MDIMMDIVDGTGTIRMNAAGTDLELDEGFETAIRMSLFSNARSRPDDVPSDLSEDRGGAWFDSEFGSLLWLLDRSALTATLARTYGEFAEKALAWMVTEGAAKSVSVVATKSNSNTLVVDITIERPDGSSSIHEYLLNWKAVEGSIRAS